MTRGTRVKHEREVDEWIGWVKRQEMRGHEGWKSSRHKA